MESLLRGTFRPFSEALGSELKIFNMDMLSTGNT